MPGKFRVNLVKYIVELNEKLIFNRKIIKFYKKKLKNQLETVIDVGSNTGQSIDLFLKVNPLCKIQGFEPNPELYKFLMNKYSINKNIEINKTGISNYNGTKLFYENLLHSTSSFEILNYNSTYLKKKARILGVAKEDIIQDSYEVNVVTLSQYINTYCKKDIDILKIDTEGHEYYCLEGLFQNQLNRKIKYIQIEEHSDDMYLNKKPFEEIQNILLVNGYKVVKKISHGFGNFHEVIFQSID